MSLTVRRFFGLVAPFALLALIVGIIADRNHLRNEKAAILVKEASFLREQQQKVTNIFTLIVSDINFLTNTWEVHEIISNPALKGLDNLEDKFLTFSKTREFYDQVRLLDDKGMEVVRINQYENEPYALPRDQLQDKSDRYYFTQTQGLSKGKIYISPFDLNMEHGSVEQPFKPIIRFSAPIYDKKNRFMGVVVLNYLGNHLLAAIEQTEHTSLQGRKLMANSKGYWLRGPKPEDEWGFVIQDRSERNLENQFPAIWPEISSKDSGQIDQPEGLFTFITLYPNREAQKSHADVTITEGESFWKLISFLPTKLLIQNHHAYRIRLFSTYMVFLALLCTWGWMMATAHTKRILSEKNLNDAQNKISILASVFENTVEGISITDIDGNIVSVNPGFTAITGYSAEEVIGKNPRILKSDHQGPEFYDQMWQSLVEKGTWNNEIWNRRKSGEVYPERLSITAIRDQGGRLSHYVAVFYDISDIKQGEEQLRHQANHDVLTGLPNRQLFVDRLETALAHDRRRGLKLAVLFLDMDNFKTINDSLGHNIGDLFLQQTANILESCIREEDTVARIGGDEFVILLPEIKDERDAIEVAQRIVQSFTSPLTINGNDLFASASIGISIFPNDGQHADGLIKNADLAMYNAKARGKNNFQLFTEAMNEDMVRRLELENSLRRALERDEFEVLYQPKVDTFTKKIDGCEALVRLRKDGQLISPMEFISIAEETGLIVPIGQWILNTACQTARTWKENGYPVRVAVNLSPRQFREKGFVDMVLSAIDETKLSPSLLELEITESIVMDDINETIDKLNRLRTKGISFAIDDFGTGYSSLQYLKKLPIDTLKIDRTFIKELPENQGDAAITVATISMAHSLGLKVVAEGVETIPQFDFLGKHGCHFIQGYLFSKPVEADSFYQMLQQESIMSEFINELND